MRIGIASSVNEPSGEAVGHEKDRNVSVAPTDFAKQPGRRPVRVIAASGSGSNGRISLEGGHGSAGYAQAKSSASRCNYPCQHLLDPRMSVFIQVKKLCPLRSTFRAERAAFLPA